MLDAAEAAYGEFDVAHVRTETRRIWTGSRYAVREVNVFDLGRPATVTPSAQPLVKDVAYKRKEHRERTIDRVLDYIEENGPQRLTDLQVALDISHSTLIWSLQNYVSVSQDANKYWHLSTASHIPQERTYSKQSTEKVQAFLKANGPSVVNEIVLGVGLSKSTIRSVLYRRQPASLFRRVGERKVPAKKNNSTRTATVWGLVREDGDGHD